MFPLQQGDRAFAGAGVVSNQSVLGQISPIHRLHRGPARWAEPDPGDAARLGVTDQKVGKRGQSSSTTITSRVAASLAKASASR